jgi:hypothetical protein
LAFQTFDSVSGEGYYYSRGVSCALNPISRPWGTSSVNYTTIIDGYRYIKGNNWWIWFPLKDSSNVRNVYNCTFQSELSLNYVCSI